MPLSTKLKWTLAACIEKRNETARCCLLSHKHRLHKQSSSRYNMEPRNNGPNRLFMKRSAAVNRRLLKRRGRRNKKKTLLSAVYFINRKPLCIKHADWCFVTAIADTHKKKKRRKQSVGRCERNRTHIQTCKESQNRQRETGRSRASLLLKKK